MRLIDADALKDNMFHYAAPEMVWDRGDIEHKINEMPTIPAIQVAWVEEQRDRIRNIPRHGKEIAGIIDGLLAMWRKEQEAK